MEFRVTEMLTVLAEDSGSVLSPSEAETPAKDHRKRVADLARSQLTASKAPRDTPYHSM